MGVSLVVPDSVDMRGPIAEATAEPTYTVQRNMLENLHAMRAAASNVLAELASR